MILITKRWKCAGLLGLALAAGAAPLAAQFTETPFTVPSGRFLVEMDAISVRWDRDEPGGGKTSAVAVATTFLTVGLGDRLDVQVGAELYLSQKFDRGGPSERRSGVGDVYLRTKLRVWGEEGSSAVALIPYVKLPTSSGGVSSDSVEGGLIVPWSVALPGGGKFRAMAQGDLRRNAADDGYDVFTLAAVAVDRPLTGSLGVYGEVTAARGSGGEPWAGTIGAGVTLHRSDFMWWDIAVYRGISDGAADWNPVVRFNFGF